MAKRLVSATAFLMFAILMIAQGANQNPQSHKGPCDEANTQKDLNQCFAAESSKADAQLDRIYTNLLNQRSGEAAQKLKAAQRAWVQYRDLHCDAARFEYEGGSVSPMVFAQCMASITKHRIEDLQAAYQEPSSE